MGVSPKWVKSKRRRKKKEERRERAKVGDNNGQATHGARKHEWRTQAAWANTNKLESQFVLEHSTCTNPRIATPYVHCVMFQILMDPD